MGCLSMAWSSASVFFFNDTATTEIYSLSLHDALPISEKGHAYLDYFSAMVDEQGLLKKELDRKSTRLNSSHGYISYAVFCLKKKKHHPKGRPTDRVVKLRNARRPDPSLSHHDTRAHRT